MPCAKRKAKSTVQMFDKRKRTRGKEHGVAGICIIRVDLPLKHRMVPTQYAAVCLLICTVYRSLSNTPHYACESNASLACKPKFPWTIRKIIVTTRDHSHQYLELLRLKVAPKRKLYQQNQNYLHLIYSLL